MVAPRLLDGGLVLPAVTAQLASHYLGALGERCCQFVGQLEVALHTFDIRTIQTEDGLGVAQVNIVGQLTVLRDAFRRKVTKADRKGLQFSIFIGETG